MKAYPAIDVQTDSPDLAVALVDDFGPTAVDDQHTGSARIFFPSSDARDAALRALASRFDVTAVDVPDEDWARRSQENLTPPAYEWGPIATPVVAIPGVTPFV